MLKLVLRYFLYIHILGFILYTCIARFFFEEIFIDSLKQFKKNLIILGRCYALSLDTIADIPKILYKAFLQTFLKYYLKFFADIPKILFKVFFADILKILRW